MPFILKKIPLVARPFLTFFVFAAVVIICKLSTLDVPYYWDEIGWSKGAYWLSGVNLLRAVPGFHPAETFLGRPPALHVTLAILFKFFGQSITTAHLLILCFAILGVYATYLLGHHVYNPQTGFFAALFLFLSPIYFVQSGMFLADLPIAALGVLCIYLALKEKYLPYLFCASYMVLIKETSILLIASWLLYSALQTPPRAKDAWIRLLKYSAPLFVIFLFLVWQKFITGYFAATYDPQALSKLESRFVYQAVMITKWAFVYQERYIFSVLIALNFVFNRAARQRRESLLFFLILLSVYLFSFIYPYFLPRYLLLALPYFCLLGASSLLELVKPAAWKIPAAAVACLFMLRALATQPFSGNAELNLRYLDVVRLHRQICQILVAEFPSSRIVTSWPHTRELQSPHWGYVTQALSATSFGDQGEMSVDDERHLREADLILVSPVPGTPAMNELRTYALNNNWRLIRRLEKEPVVTELYRRPLPR